MKTLKRAKRVLGLLLTIALVVTFIGFNTNVTKAEDEDSYTITITDSSNDAGKHTYKAYKVFDISVADDSSVTVDDWGAGVDGTALLTALKADSTIGTYFTDCTTAHDVALVLSNATNFPSDTAAAADADSKMKALTKIIAANLNTAAGTSTVSGSNDEITVDSVGYYFIQDASAPTLGNGDNSGAYTRFILQVVSDTAATVAAKTDAPKVVKKVYEDNCTDSTYGTGYNDVADYETGEDVAFKIIATLPTNASAYDTYKLVFNDTLDSHFGTVKDIAVTINGTAVTSGYTSTGSLTLTIADVFTAAGADTKALKEALNGKDVIVTYKAKLLETAEVGTGYENKVSITYSNNPNNSGEGNNNNGTTPEDKVIVFTYGGEFTKVDSKNNNTPLSGAKFVLTDSSKAKYAVLVEGKVSSWTTDKTQATVLTTAANGTFQIAGIDAATTYYLEETDAPTGYTVPSDPYVEVKADQKINITQSWDGDASSAYTGTNADAFKVTKTITNTKMTSTLPTTGGMGTTVFYVVGSILLIGAAILLITRKRTEKE